MGNDINKPTHTNAIAHERILANTKYVHLTGNSKQQCMKHTHKSIISFLLVS